MQHIKRFASGIVPFLMLSLPMAAQAAGVNLGLTSDVEGALGLGTQDVRVTIARIINVFMGLLGIIAVVIILYGGFIWMTAAGNEERVDKARKMIVAGVIGLAIILSAYAIARFVVNSLVNATS
ncbi:hypothetical protein EPO33_04060 [Patescibacteria group bacterium]|nr:MAG: hypothetical protein EPO33_04060 [Patescibacteria group bacterium]